MNTNTRIQLTDSTMDIIVKMSEGNPGAMNVLMQMIKDGGAIDPDDFMGGIGAVLALDSHGIYGTDIYILNNDICDRDLTKMLAVLRSCQLGYFNGDLLADACNRQDRSGKALIPVDELCDKVKERLPNFGKI